MNRGIKGFRAFAVAALLLAGSQAQALLLGPGDADWSVNTVPALHGSDVAAIVGTSSTLELFYKSDFGGSDSGSFAGSYSTAYSGHPNNALISYLGGASILCPECYLVVKDGNQPQYLFNLASWSGTDALDLQGFYPGRGAISHVAIWGKSAVQVNESGILVLFGLGLIGLGFARRRKIS